MLNKEAFESKFSPDWWAKISQFWGSGGFEPIYTHLKERAKMGLKIVPASADTFRCFRETNLSDLKCVMMGLSPYHTLTKEGYPIADGLLMGCSNSNICSPSLKQYYKGAEKELSKGLDLSLNEEPDVSFLAKQGVLMFNASLTTEVGTAGKHLNLWKSFTRFILEDIISLTGVPVLFLGKDAAKFQRYLGPLQWSFVVDHPAYAAYTETTWDTKEVFTKLNKILMDSNGVHIEWYQRLPF